LGESASGAVYQTEDEEGLMGVRLSKDVVKVAGKAMEKNLTRVGPLILPISEQVQVVISIVMRLFRTFKKGEFSIFYLK